MKKLLKAMRHMNTVGAWNKDTFNAGKVLTIGGVVTTLVGVTLLSLSMYKFKPGQDYDLAMDWIPDVLS